MKYLSSSFRVFSVSLTYIRITKAALYFRPFVTPLAAIDGKYNSVSILTFVTPSAAINDKSETIFITFLHHAVVDKVMEAQRSESR